MKPTPITDFPENYVDSVRARIAARTIAAEGDCWEWQGVRDRYGYGKITVTINGKKRQTGAHRASWIAHRGPIPSPSLQIDHLCRVRHCANPAHMELVTNRVNSLRGDHSNKAGRSGRKYPGPPQSCPTHARSNGYVYTNQRNGYSVWICRPCRRRRTNEWRARNRRTD